MARRPARENTGIKLVLEECEMQYDTKQGVAAGLAVHLAGRPGGAAL